MRAADTIPGGELAKLLRSSWHMPVSHSVQKLGSSWHSVRAYLSLGLEKNKSDEISKKFRRSL